MSDFSQVKVGDTNLEMVLPREGREPERESARVVRVTDEVIACMVAGRCRTVFDLKTGVNTAGEEYGHLEFKTT